MSICVFYPLLRDSKPPIKALGPPRQQSVLDEECLEFLGKVFDEDYLPSIINRFELAMIPRVSATTVTRSSKIDENPLEVDTLTLMMMRIKEQEEAGEVNLEDLPKWTFGDLLELDEAFLVEEPLDLNQNQVNRFKNKVKKFKTNKFGVVVKLSKSLRGMKKGEIEMMENATLTKEELLEQNKIHQELQKQSTMKESQQAEAKDDAYGFLASKVKLKGARGRAIASKMKALGFDSRASFAYFDENVMNDSVLKSDLGLVAVEVRKFREACLKEKELLPEGDTSHQPKQQKTVTKRDQSPRPDRLSAGSTRKDVSRTDKPSTTSPSLLKEKTGESPKKQGKGKGMIRASTKEKVNNRGDKNPITTDTSLRGTIL